jgi:acetylornithine deacetylase/succinyl-diaminopimelate desuccinylase-like protein
MTTYTDLDNWIDAHFDEQVAFLQELIRVPTDTPPGNNAPHAERTFKLLQAMGITAEKHPVPAAEVQAAGLQSITNLIVRRAYGAAGSGPVIALNAHGDVVPPGDGWAHQPDRAPPLWCRRQNHCAQCPWRRGTPWRRLDP